MGNKWAAIVLGPTANKQNFIPGNVGNQCGNFDSDGEETWLPSTVFVPGEPILPMTYIMTDRTAGPGKPQRRTADVFVAVSAPMKTRKIDTIVVYDESGDSSDDGYCIDTFEGTSYTYSKYKGVHDGPGSEFVYFLSTQTDLDDDGT